MAPCSLCSLVMLSIVTRERKGWRGRHPSGQLSLSALEYEETSSLLKRPTVPGTVL